MTDNWTPVRRKPQPPRRKRKPTMTLAEALAIYVMIKEQSLGAKNEAQRLAEIQARKIIQELASAAIADWEWRK